MSGTDNPAEYVAHLEFEVRRERARATRLETELADLRADLAASDDIRSSLVTAGADAAGTTETTLRRLEEYQAIVDAAVRWHQASVIEFPQVIHELKHVVDAHLERVSKQS